MKKRSRFGYFGPAGAILIAGLIVIVIPEVLMRFAGGIVEKPYVDGVAFSYPLSRIGLAAGFGVVLIALGFRLGLDRQFYNWTFVGAGVALLIFGTSFIAMERAVVTSEYFELRRWWGHSTQRWHYDEVTALRLVHRERPGTKRALRITLQVRELDGRWDTVVNDTGLYGIHGPFERELWKRMSEKGIPENRTREE